MNQHSKMYPCLVCGSQVQCAGTHRDEKLVEISQERRIFGSWNLKVFIPFKLVCKRVWLNICL